MVVKDIRIILTDFTEQEADAKDQHNMDLAVFFVDHKALETYLKIKASY